MQLIDFTTNGPSALVGRYRGVATLLHEEINLHLTIINCMNYKLELALHDMVKHTTDASHFKMFTHSLYAFFSIPTKLKSLLEIKFQGIHFKMIHCIFLIELALLKDALESLKTSSLFLQRRDATAIEANSEVTIALRALRSMTLTGSVNTKCLKEEFDIIHTFKVYI